MRRSRFIATGALAVIQPAGPHHELMTIERMVVNGIPNSGKSNSPSGHVNLAHNTAALPVCS